MAEDLLPNAAKKPKTEAQIAAQITKNKKNHDRRRANRIKSPAQDKHEKMKMMKFYMCLEFAIAYDLQVVPRFNLLEKIVTGNGALVAINFRNRLIFFF